VSSLHRPSTFALTLAALCVCSSARADVSSWLFTGGGISLLDLSGNRTAAGTLHIDAGLGSSPRAPIAVGGIARVAARFGQGTDLGVYLRLATRGYNMGDWGAAVDLGGLHRFWDGDPQGFGGTLSLGAPWGVTLSVDASHETNGDNTFATVLGIDFARLTDYRRTGLSWLANPFPAPQPEAR